MLSRSRSPFHVYRYHHTLTRAIIFFQGYITSELASMHTDRIQTACMRSWQLSCTACSSSANTVTAVRFRHNFANCKSKLCHYIAIASNHRSRGRFELRLSWYPVPVSRHDQLQMANINLMIKGSVLPGLVDEFHFNLNFEFERQLQVQR